MNAPATIAPAPLTEQMLVSARDLAYWHEDQGRPGTCVTIHILASEIETLREAAKGSLVIVNQAIAGKTFAELKASALLSIAQKLQPFIDDEIEQRQSGGNVEDWAALQVLSNELHAAMRLARP